MSSAYRATRSAARYWASRDAQAQQAEAMHKAAERYTALESLKGEAYTIGLAELVAFMDERRIREDQLVNRRLVPPNFLEEVGQFRARRQ